jgi:3-hydroxyisobutyrate dehydrogenase-like beta-hydroxyacid dehydrogenase
MRIAFVGLGRMGSPMARNLIRAGHHLTVFNRTWQKAEALKKDGARVAGSPEEALAEAEVLVTMLADDRAVRETVLSAIDALPKGAIHMSASTISLECSEDLEREHAARGQRYLAAAVLGRPEAAEQRKLWVVAAGPGEVVERCRPLMEAIGQGISIVGAEPWKANLTKIAVNFMLASMLESLGEAFALIEKYGLDAREFLKVLNGGIFHSPVFENYGNKIAGREYQPGGFSLALGLKDTELALAAGRANQVPLPAASLLRDHYLEALAQGDGGLDWSAVAEIARLHAGLQRRQAA